MPGKKKSTSPKKKTSKKKNNLNGNKNTDSNEIVYKRFIAEAEQQQLSEWLYRKNRELDQQIRSINLRNPGTINLENLHSDGPRLRKPMNPSSSSSSFLPSYHSPSSSPYKTALTNSLSTIQENTNTWSPYDRNTSSPNRYDNSSSGYIPLKARSQAREEKRYQEKEDALFELHEEMRDTKRYLLEMVNNAVASHGYSKYDLVEMFIGKKNIPSAFRERDTKSSLSPNKEENAEEDFFVLAKEVINVLEIDLGLIVDSKMISQLIDDFGIDVEEKNSNILSPSKGNDRNYSNNIIDVQGMLMYWDLWPSPYPRPDSPRSKLIRKLLDDNHTTQIINNEKHRREEEESRSTRQLKGEEKDAAINIQRLYRGHQGRELSEKIKSVNRFNEKSKTLQNTLDILDKSGEIKKSKSYEGNQIVTGAGELSDLHDPDPQSTESVMQNKFRSTQNQKLIGDNDIGKNKSGIIMDESKIPENSLVLELDKLNKDSGKSLDRVLKNGEVFGIMDSYRSDISQFLTSRDLDPKY